MLATVAPLYGIVVPLITPLDRYECIDEPHLRRLVDYLIEGGVHGIFVNSTTGEGVCLKDSQRQKALDIVVRQVNKRIPVYAGMSDTGTARALDNLQQVMESGADIAVAHPPYYFPPNAQEELYDYFAQIAQTSTLPLMLYNIPFTTKAPIALETVRKLLKIENIIGIKDSSVDYVYLMNLIELKHIRPDFCIFIGKTHMWTAGILSGADGGLDGISNLIPKHCVQLYEMLSKKEPAAYALQREINEIWRVYECKSFLGGIKGALSLLDLCLPYTIKPVLQADAAEMAKIEGILRTHGILR